MTRPTYTPFATIKDFDEGKLEKRISEMEKRGYELISRASRSDFGRLVHYAKLKFKEETHKLKIQL